MNKMFSIALAMLTAGASCFGATPIQDDFSVSGPLTLTPHEVYRVMINKGEDDGKTIFISHDDSLVTVTKESELEVSLGSLPVGFYTPTITIEEEYGSRQFQQVINVTDDPDGSYAEHVKVVDTDGRQLSYKDLLTNGALGIKSFNSSPRLTCDAPDEMTVRVGQTASFPLRLFDQQGEEIHLQVSTGDSLPYTINRFPHTGSEQSYTFTYTPTTVSRREIKFWATDTSGLATTLIRKLTVTADEIGPIIQHGIHFNINGPNEINRNHWSLAYQAAWNFTILSNTRDLRLPMLINWGDNEYQWIEQSDWMSGIPISHHYKAPGNYTIQATFNLGDQEIGTQRHYVHVY